MLSFPKRLRYFLHGDSVLAGRVFAVAVRAFERRLRGCFSGAPVTSRFGAVTFIQRFGLALNARLHVQICVIDGVFSQDAARELRFHRAVALEPSDVTAAHGLVQHRVLRLFEHAGLLGPEAAENMREWRHTGGVSATAPALLYLHPCT